MKEYINIVNKYEMSDLLKKIMTGEPDIDGVDILNKETWTPWYTEYIDTISDIGNTVIEESLPPEEKQRRAIELHNKEIEKFDLLLNLIKEKLSYATDWISFTEKCKDVVKNGSGLNEKESFQLNDIYKRVK